jgi:hypothetical protein
MTIRNKALECDVPGCKRMVVGTGRGRANRARKMRRQAAEEGWVRTEAGADLCAEHKGTEATEAGALEATDHGA